LGALPLAAEALNGLSQAGTELSQKQAASEAGTVEAASTNARATAARHNGVPGHRLFLTKTLENLVHEFIFFRLGLAKSQICKQQSTSNVTPVICSSFLGLPIFGEYFFGTRKLRFSAP
jgi:hypothetical protein